MCHKPTCMYIKLELRHIITSHHTYLTPGMLMQVVGTMSAMKDVAKLMRANAELRSTQTSGTLQVSAHGPGVCDLKVSLTDLI